MSETLGKGVCDPDTDTAEDAVEAEDPGDRRGRRPQVTHLVAEQHAEAGERANQIQLLVTSELNNANWQC